MRTTNTPRRARARSAVALIAFAVMACSSARADDAFQPEPGSDPIVGTWVCNGSPPPFMVIKSFHVGGTVIEMDNLGFQESAAMGNWKRTAHLKYFLHLRQFVFNADNTFAGTFKYTQPLTIHPSLTSLDGTFHAIFVDPSGKESDAGNGSVTCTRL